MSDTDLSINNQNIEVSKKFEVINFRALRDLPEQSYLKYDFRSWVVNESEVITDVDKVESKKYKKLGVKTQFRCFQSAMKSLLGFGRLIGLNPVSSILSKDVSEIRFTFLSWTSLYSTIITIAHTVTVCCAFHVLLHSPVSIRSLTFAWFFCSIWCMTLFFTTIATKWSVLIKEIFNCNLDEYADVNVIKKIKIFCIAVFILTLFEIILSLLSKIVHVMDCTIEYDLFEGLTRHTFPWLFDLGVPYSVPLGLLMQIINTIALFKWNYTDLFIICMSLYLTSILDQINKKIKWAANNNSLPASIWTDLREDYTRATRLVRRFDEVFSGLILVSFACNLFYLCLQLFNILANEVQMKQTLLDKCPNFPSGPLRGYEHPIYLVFTLGYVFIRFLTLSLIAASVNVSSTTPAHVLYMLPSASYCKEVQRFLDQIHGEVVALSGLEFFHITRHLILSAAGTLVTYELVLLQFNSDDLKQV